MVSIAFEGTTCSSERTYLVGRNQDKTSTTYCLDAICKTNRGEYTTDLILLLGIAVTNNLGREPVLNLDVMSFICLIYQCRSNIRQGTS
jgi:hypothetical protein